MKKIQPFSLLIVIFLSALVMPNKSLAQFTIDIESGVVKTGYNDVRIPGDEGTFISFSDELKSISDIYYRLRGEYNFGKRSTILVLIAPLEQTYKGHIFRDISFQNELFNAGTFLNATYKFNSYRLSYRYSLVKGDKFDVTAGLTLKIRDALISIEGDLDKYAEKKDFGLVPLISFSVHWKPIDKFGLLLDGDALAAPQGRAEDVLLAITYRVGERLSIKSGYRILEGGADNDIVYTYSLFH